jgi:hypothetical protein
MGFGRFYWQAVPLYAKKQGLHLLRRRQTG